MRMLAASLLVVASACSAEIAPDTYFCGPERLCPEGLACNNLDNVCTVPTGVQAFDCVDQLGMTIPDRNDDDTPTSGFDVTNEGSCLQNRELRACLFENDPGDWFQFDLADSCGTSVKMTGRLTFAVAFEPVAVHLSVEDGTPMPIDVECDQTSSAAGQTQRCFEMALTGNTHYAVGMVHSEVDNCDGECRHNRYVLDLRLEAAD